jgi:hypothetical protein
MEIVLYQKYYGFKAQLSQINVNEKHQNVQHLNYKFVSAVSY